MDTVGGRNPTLDSYARMPVLYRLLILSADTTFSIGAQLFAFVAMIRRWLTDGFIGAPDPP